MLATKIALPCELDMAHERPDQRIVAAIVVDDPRVETQVRIEHARVPPPHHLLGECLVGDAEPGGFRRVRVDDRPLGGVAEQAGEVWGNRREAARIAMVVQRAETLLAQDVSSASAPRSRRDERSLRARRLGAQQVLLT